MSCWLLQRPDWTTKEDEFHKVVNGLPIIKKLIESGYTGRKGKGGFYRMNKVDNKKILEAINLETGEYRPTQKINIKIIEYAFMTIFFRIHSNVV